MEPENTSAGQTPRKDGGEQDDSRRRDPFAPPDEPCECWCMHCHRTFMSDQIWFQRVKGARDGFEGFWMCPTPNCDGAGFTFDIFPTDPNHPANDGWFDDDEPVGDREWNWEDEDESDDDLDEEMEEFDESDELFDSAEPHAEWDPDEPHYKAMDEWDGDDEDMEGEEWKYGLQPGERPKADPPPPGVEPRNWAEQEALYDAPDRRPREVDWSDREPNVFRDDNDDDIPF
jgi:hypothetical protein